MKASTNESRAPMRLALLGLFSIGVGGLWGIYRALAPPQDVPPDAWLADQRVAVAGSVGAEGTRFHAPATGAASRVEQTRSAPEDFSGQVGEQIAASLRTEQTLGALNELGMQTMSDDAGNVIGLQGNAPYAWASAGLRDTDLISAIDGVPVQRIIATPTAMARLATEENLRLTVMRGNTPTTIRVGERPLTAA